MSPPTVAAMRHRVTIEAPIDVSDDLGGFMRTFAPRARVWAQIDALGASEQFVEQRPEQLRRYAVTVRWRADLKSDMRFDFRGRKLVIRSLEDKGERRRFLQCLCEEFS
ncbi:MAG: head-tail adaptor protein [Hyphomicrobiales bacterium]|nr:MAG: head-tail adaptor protein [Hyphomicrobiales bacterium]